MTIGRSGVLIYSTLDPVEESGVLEVQVVIRGVLSAETEELEALTENLRILGADDPAVVFWPRNDEIGMQFQLKECVFGQLLEPKGDCLAA